MNVDNNQNQVTKGVMGSNEQTPQQAQLIKGLKIVGAGVAVVGSGIAVKIFMGKSSTSKVAAKSKPLVSKQATTTDLLNLNALEAQAYSVTSDFKENVTVNLPTGLPNNIADINNMSDADANAALSELNKLVQGLPLSHQIDASKFTPQQHLVLGSKIVAAHNAHKLTNQPKPSGTTNNPNPNKQDPENNTEQPAGSKDGTDPNTQQPTGNNDNNVETPEGTKGKDDKTPEGTKGKDDKSAPTGATNNLETDKPENKKAGDQTVTTGATDNIEKDKPENKKEGDQPVTTGTTENTAKDKLTGTVENLAKDKPANKKEDDQPAPTGTTDNTAKDKLTVENLAKDKPANKEQGDQKIHQQQAAGQDGLPAQEILDTDAKPATLTHNSDDQKSNLTQDGAPTQGGSAS